MGGNEGEDVDHTKLQTGRLENADQLRAETFQTQKFSPPRVNVFQKKKERTHQNLKACTEWNVHADISLQKDSVCMHA